MAIKINPYKNIESLLRTFKGPENLTYTPQIPNDGALLLQYFRNDPKKKSEIFEIKEDDKKVGWFQISPEDVIEVLFLHKENRKQEIFDEVARFLKTHLAEKGKSEYTVKLPAGYLSEFSKAGFKSSSCVIKEDENEQMVYYYILKLSI